MWGLSVGTCGPFRSSVHRFELRSSPWKNKGNGSRSCTFQDQIFHLWIYLSSCRDRYVTFLQASPVLRKSREHERSLSLPVEAYSRQQQTNDQSPKPCSIQKVIWVATDRPTPSPSCKCPELQMGWPFPASDPTRQRRTARVSLVCKEHGTKFEMLLFHCSSSCRRRVAKDKSPLLSRRVQYNAPRRRVLSAIWKM